MLIDIVLEVGEVTETVEETACVPLLESAVFTAGQFLIRGNVIRPRVAVAGSQGDQQHRMIDEVSSSSTILEIPRGPWHSPVDAAQEIRVEQSNCSAEYGNSANGVVTATTKLGTSNFHGDLHGFLRKDKFDARAFFARSRAPLCFNIFGPAMREPIARNRAFFVVDSEPSGACVNPNLEAINKARDTRILQISLKFHF